MADPPVDAGTYPGAPRWVRMMALVGLVVLLVVVVILVFGPGDHGPGRHVP